MDNLIDIKEKLNEIHQEYKTNKSQLNKDKTKTTAKLIVEMTLSNDVRPADIAFELLRFSVDVVKIYFDSLTPSMNISIELLDKILKEFLTMAKNAKKLQNRTQKFVFTVIAIMKNYKDKALNLKQLPHFVAFIAQFAVKSDKNRNKFQNLINHTTGEIFILDYADINRNLLVNIWAVTSSIFPDLSKAKYESFITDWGKKYGFIQENTDKLPEESAKLMEEQNLAENKPTTEPEKLEKIVPAPVPDKNSPDETIAKKLYTSLKRDMDKERETIITAFTDMFAPVNKAFEIIQGEINTSREIEAENISLKAKIENLEKQLSEQKIKFETVNQSLVTVRTENDKLKKKITFLESQNAELDQKLTNAYAINSRESSLEAEKIRSELKKAFSFLYEDWLEYEFSDVSEENYESLQAIIKKIFRSLERNGIDFKGNNE